MNMNEKNKFESSFEDEQIRSKPVDDYVLAADRNSETSLWSGIDSVAGRWISSDLDTMDRWSVAEIGKHWLSVADLSTDFTRSASIEVHRIGHRVQR